MLSNSYESSSGNHLTNKLLSGSSHRRTYIILSSAVMLFALLSVLVAWHVTHASPPVSTVSVTKQEESKKEASSMVTQPDNTTSVETSVESSVDSSQNNINNEVQVNGEQIDLPASGSVHKEINDSNGKTTVDVSVDSSTSGSTRSTSSTKLQLHSSTKSVSTEESSQ